MIIYIGVLSFNIEIFNDKNYNVKEVFFRIDQTNFYLLFVVTFSD